MATEKETESRLRALHGLFREIRTVDSDLPANYPAVLVAIALAEASQGSYLRIGGIAQVTGILQSSVSRLLKSMEANQFITRISDPHDARSTRIALAAKGKEFVDRMIGFIGMDNTDDVEFGVVSNGSNLPSAFRFEVDTDRMANIARIEKIEDELETLKSRIYKKDD